MKKYLIEDVVMFDVHQMTLAGTSRTTELTANESELLEMVLDGLATKTAIIHRIWGSKGLIVTDSSYHQLVRAVRGRLGESGVSGALIKTLPRQGLKFMGVAHALPLESAASFTSPPQSGTDTPAQATTTSLEDEPTRAFAGSLPATPEASTPVASQAAAAWPWHKAIRRAERLLLLGVVIWAALVTWQMTSLNDLTDRFPRLTGQFQQPTQ